MADRPSSDHVAAWRALLTPCTRLPESGRGSSLESRARDAHGAFAVLTPEGLQALCRCWRSYSAEIEARVGRRLTGSDARTLRALLTQLVEAA